MAGQDFAHNAAPSRKTTDKPVQTSSILPAIAILFIAGACFSGGYWLGAGDIQQTGNKADIDAVEARLAIKHAEIKLLHARIETLEALVKQWKDKAKQGLHTKVGELSFYTALPKQSVMPTPVSATPAAKAAAKAVRQAQFKAASLKPASNRSTHHSSRANDTIAVQKAIPKTHKLTTQTHKQAVDHLNAYRIQIASFRKQSDATPLRQQLEGAGFPAFIHAVDLAGKGQWFRVYAGPFPSKTAAQGKQLQIEKKLHIKGLLLRGS